MNIQVEDFFGNDVIKLNYCLRNKEISEGKITVVGVIASNCGYNLADVDCDDDGIDFIRLQQANVDNTEIQEKKDLMKLINNLNKRFL
jgi:hypothetical protein